MKHVVLFAPWFPPQRNSEAHATGRFALALVRAGWELEVITLRPDHGGQSGAATGPWERLAGLTHVVPERPLSAPRRAVSRLTGLLTFGHAVRGLAWAHLAVRQALKLHSLRPFEIILSRSEPGYGHLPALHLARRLAVPWIANWNDVEPPDRYPPPYGAGPDAAIPRRVLRFDRAVVRSAGHNTFCSERLLRYMARWLPELADRSSVIPHVVLDTAPSPSEAGGGNEFVICHAGNVGGARDPGTFLRAAARFVAVHGGAAPIRIRFLGCGKDPAFIESAPLALRPLVETTPWLAYGDVSDALRRASVLVVIEAPVSEGIFFPNKFAEYVEADRPILAVSPGVGTLADLLGEHGGGLACDCASEDSISAAIEALYRSWRAGRLDAEFPRARLRAAIGEEAVVRKVGEAVARASGRLAR